MRTAGLSLWCSRPRVVKVKPEAEARRRTGKGEPGSCSFRLRRDAEAEVVVPAGRRIDAAHGAAAHALAPVQPRRAAQHLARTARRSLRVDLRADGVPVLVVPVGAPLPGVAE